MNQEYENPVLCASCGKNNITISHVEDKFVYGEGSSSAQLVAIVSMHTCNVCGFQFLDNKAEDSHHEAVCRHLGVLTPSQIRALRTRLGLTRTAFANLTRLEENTLAEWERGASIQTAAYDQFLYLLFDSSNVQKLKLRNRIIE